MRFYLWGLVVGILWAQLVWDWHAEQDQGLGYHIPVVSSLPHSQLFYRVKLVGDTLWVMGNTCVRATDTLYLPSTNGAKEVYRNLSPAPVAVSYIAGYDRKTGELKLAYLAYVNPNESYAIRFQDFAVSENQDTLWVAVDLPNGGGCRNRPSSGSISVSNGTIIVQRWTSGTLSSVGWQTIFGYSLHSSASAGQVWQITRSGNEVRCVPIHWENQQTHPGLSLGFWSLVWRPGVVYVSGTCRRPDITQSGPTGSFSSLELNNAFPPTRGLEEPAYGFILRVSTGSSFAITHAAAIGMNRVPPSSPFQTYGRSLILFGDTVFFLVGVRADGGSWDDTHILYAKSSAGPVSTLDLGGLSSGSPPSGRVILVGFNANTLAPLLTQSGLLAYAWLWNYDGINGPNGGPGLPQPPALYPVVVGDTLYIAWSDEREVGVPTGASGVGFAPGPRIYVMGWAGLSTYGSSWSAFGAGWPAYTSIPGQDPGPVSGMVRWGDTLWVSCTGGSNGLYPLFLLHRQVNPASLSSVPAVRPAFASDTVEIGGLAIDGAGHLYAAGIIHGGCVYARVRPKATAVSITSLSGPYGVGGFGYGRGWVGRLLNYRYAAEGGIIPNRCVPDTVQHGNLSYVLWGHFSWGEKVVFTWEGSEAARAQYGFLWRPGAVYTVSSDKPDSLHVALSWAAFPGWADGSYRLQPRLLVWQWPDTLRLEGESPLSLVSGGYTLPSLYRQDSTERWWVVPFIGDASKSVGWRNLGASFHRRAGYIDGNASLKPHYVFAYVPYHPFLQEEVVYVAVNYTDSVFLYRVHVATGQVYRERGWPRLSDHQPGHEVHPDTIVGGIQQLHYSASYGHLLAVEGAYRLRAIPLTDISHRFLTHRQRTGYTQKPSLRSQPAVLTTDISGRLFYWVREEDIWGDPSYHLLQYELPAPWSGLPIEIHSVDQTNACMQDGLPYTIASIRAMVSVEDTLFFLDWGPYDRGGGGGCSSDSVLRLRKLSLGVGDVQTLATFYNAGSVSVLDSFRLGLLYRPLPAPHLLIAVPMYEGGSGQQRRDYLLRYWLDGRPKALDTILGRGSPTGCAYGLDKLVSLRWPHLISFDQNRSGLLLFSAEREIRAALPLYINRHGEIDRTAWGTVQPIQGLQVDYPGRDVAASSSGNMLSWAVDSLAYAGEDSLTLRVSVCSPSVEERHQTQHRFYRLPQFLFGVYGPSPVCQGQIFHGKVGFGGEDFLSWQNSQVGRPEACGGLALFDSIMVGVVPAGKVVELIRIQTDDPIESAIAPITVRYYAADSCSLCRYEGVVRGLVSGEDSAFFRAFLERLSAGGDFEIRRGHQVRLRVAVEGPAARARSGLQRLAPHPLLRRDTIAYCIEQREPPLADSLWIVPTRRNGNVERWRRMDNRPISADVAASPEAWQRPAWALPCRIEVREGSPDGTVTDDLWGLVDTLGWVWPLRPPLIDSTDSPTHPLRAYYRGRLLSFCQCDTNANKWIVVRFPNHIALRSAGPLSLSGNLLSNDPDNPVTIDLTDPTYLDGIPGYHYAIVPDSLNPGQMQAAAWAGNVDDCYEPHHDVYPGQDPPDCSRINAADWEMLLPRNGLNPGPVFTIGDLDGDGRVDAVDFTLLINNMNQLREGVVGD
jgi:hypothetical protein